MKNSFDVAIIGAGISGAALFYALRNFTNIKRVVLLEKYGKVAELSSAANNNSQTIHDGSIETNYTFEKAKKVARAAELVRHFALHKNLQNKSIFKMQKIAIGVGDKECEYMKNRTEEFRAIFPKIEFFDKNALKNLEPNVVLGENGGDRPENVVGAGFKEDWCACNFAELANFMVESATDGEDFSVRFNHKVSNIVEQGDGGYTILCDGCEHISAKFVLVNAGAHSLFLAQRMGYGLDLGCLPVAGSFFFIPGEKLKGKVYMVQNPKLPFAAVHGDPDIAAVGKTRLGPTAISFPKLERFHSGTTMDFLRCSGFGQSATTKIIYDLFSDSEIRAYIFRNVLYELPILGRKLFLKEAKKIIPSIRVDELSYAKGFGGVRPQVLNKATKKLELGEKRIASGKGISFNMTPSPGATSCFKNALVDMREICEYLGAEINIDKMGEELGERELNWL